MPDIRTRMATIDSMSHYEPAEVTQPQQASYGAGISSPAALNLTATDSNLMSINQGNTVPMRGILPIEQMSDCDLYRFFPYTAHFDRIPKYTYYALLSQGS